MSLKDSERLFVTVECGGMQLNAALSPDAHVADLVPQILPMFGVSADESGSASQWVLTRADGSLLPGNLSLGQSGVEEGSLVRLADAAAEPPAEVADPAPAPPAPSSRSLPEAPGLGSRLRAVMEAVVSPDRVPADAALGTLERLTVPRTPSVLERAEAVWRSSDYRHRLDEWIAAPRLGSAATIAVVSPKGGVGKTTTVAALGTLLAMVRKDRVVAIDTNPDYGTLGRVLTPAHEIYVDDLDSVLHQPALTVTMLERCLGRAQHGLLVLPAPTDPERMENLDEEAYERVIHRLEELASIVILDCGAGLHDAVTRSAIASAQQLVLVTDADPTTAGVVLEAGAKLARGKPVTYLVNKMPRSGSRLNVQNLIQDMPDDRAVVQVEVEPAAAAELGRGHFSWETAPASWQTAFRELGAVLAAEWETLGLTA